MTIDGRVPKSQATLAEILKQAGYSTFYVGKWHLTGRDEYSSAGPFEQWPLGMGFERFYGFVGGETNQWFPHLAEDNHNIETPTRPGYHLSEDLTDHAIRFIAEQQQVMLYSLNDASAASRRQTQYYEMLGHRALYHQGWKAVAYHQPGADFDQDKWELYKVDEDFSESNDLAAKHPEKLREMIERWWSEAGRYNVLPLDDRGALRSLDQPPGNRPRTMATYYPGASQVPRVNTLGFRNRSFSITAETDIPPGGAEGVLLALGGRFAGFSFFVRNNRLQFVYNFFGLERYNVTSTETVPKGLVRLRLDFTRTGDNKGTAALFINDRKVGEGPIPRTVPFSFGLSEGLTAGRDPATPVTENYPSPFTFTGKLKKVVMELKEDPKPAPGN